MRRPVRYSRIWQVLVASQEARRRGQMLWKLWAWFHDEKGQDMVEYALIVTVLSIVIVAAAAGIIDPGITSWAEAVAAKILPV
jgi:Flp pilus assembly pilin Flp